MREAFGVSATTVQNWIADGLPGGNKGPWLQSQVEVFLAQRRSPVVDVPVDESTQRVREAGNVFAVARARKTMAEAEAIELKNQRTKGELVSRDEVKGELEDVFAFLRDGMKRLADDVGTEVPADLKPIVIAMVRRKVDGLLWQFAEKAGRIGG